MIWFEDLYDTYNSSELGINTQHVSVQFIDIEQDVEEIGEKSTDVMLPYERIDIVPDEWFTASRNHMVRRASHLSGLLIIGLRFYFGGGLDCWCIFPTAYVVVQSRPAVPSGLPLSIGPLVTI